MSRGPRSWTASIVGFALAVLAAAVALNLAAQYLVAALPVLVPTAVVGGGAIVGWRWWSHRRDGW